MIEKMKFVNIMGPIEDIERVKEKYLSQCDIQIEDAVTELGGAKTVSNFVIVNTYADVLRKAEHYANLAGFEGAEESHLSKEEAIAIVEDIDALMESDNAKIAECQTKKAQYEDYRTQIQPFTNLEFPLNKLLQFSFIKFRFGRIPVNSYKQIATYMYDQEGILFEKSSMDKDYVYCIYFVPEPLYEKVDAIFQSLHFEKIKIGYNFEGTPAEAHEALSHKIEACNAKIHDLEVDQTNLLQTKASDLSYALRKLKELSSYTEMQKYAAKTKDDFYIIVGWMSSKDAKKLEKRTESDDKVVLILEDTSGEIKSPPPTKLKNPALFKPFESLIRLYGLPQYNEIDPTMFFAISYCILFGLMFGDLGQGLLLSILGIYLYKFHRIALGGVMAIIGLFSAFFGLMYGSVFGYEHLIPHLWISPMHDMNTVLITTVLFGIGLNITAMVIHIINGIKNKDLQNILFDANGVSGLVFYVAILIAVLSAVTGKYSITTGIGIVFIGLPLLCIMFREPLTSLLEKRKKLIHGKISDFVLELVFETFEILLSYVTNTISFVRVGAFALCHAGMMSVVLMLAGASESSLGNPLVMILGNLFVIAMEGLVVGIQVLRLQYYEMFSRFFKGGGREFSSFKNRYKL